MFIRYFSDLHLEFLNIEETNELIQEIIEDINPPTNDICVLSGDIGNPYQETYDLFMKFMSNNFKKVFVIAGNHEYYSKTKPMDETEKYMIAYFEAFDNISYLNNTVEYYLNYCFIGTTLWSTLHNRKMAIYKPINDIYRIPNFCIDNYNELNKKCVEFLENALNNNTNCIVITHHVPSVSLIDDKYKTPAMKYYNQWFYCNLDEIITKNAGKIKAWVYGHTHAPSMRKLMNVPFYCNPIGYPNENEFVDYRTKFEIN